MESEKVKEIKKALEQNDYNGIMYEVNDQKRVCKFIHHEDILTLINELESENDTLHTNLCEWRRENQQLKDRIAELESENETLRNAKVVYENVDYCYEDLKKAEKRIAELEKENAKYKRKLTTNQWVQEIRKEALKQFAERLKNKDCSVPVHKGFILIEDHAIDELLKEYEK